MMQSRRVNWKITIRQSGEHNERMGKIKRKKKKEKNKRNIVEFPKVCYKILTGKDRREKKMFKLCLKMIKSNGNCSWALKSSTKKSIRHLISSHVHSVVENLKVKDKEKNGDRQGVPVPILISPSSSHSRHRPLTPLTTPTAPPVPATEKEELHVPSVSGKHFGHAAGSSWAGRDSLEL